MCSLAGFDLISCSTKLYGIYGIGTFTRCEFLLSSSWAVPLSLDILVCILLRPKVNKHNIIFHFTWPFHLGNLHSHTSGNPDFDRNDYNSLVGAIFFTLNAKDIYIYIYIYIRNPVLGKSTYNSQFGAIFFKAARSSFLNDHVGNFFTLLAQLTMSARAFPSPCVCRPSVCPSVWLTIGLVLNFWRFLDSSCVSTTSLILSLGVRYLFVYLLVYLVRKFFIQNASQPTILNELCSCYIWINPRRSSIRLVLGVAIWRFLAMWRLIQFVRKNGLVYSDASN